MKIKLVYSPKLYKGGKYGYTSAPYRIPEIGLPVLKTILEKRKHSVEIDDLDIKTYEKKIDLSKFDDKKRISKFIKTGSDKELEKIGEQILKLTKIEPDIELFGFSIGNEFNFSSLGTTLVLAKLVKSKLNCKVIVGGSGVRYFREIYEFNAIDADIDFIAKDTCSFLMWLDYLESGHPMLLKHIKETGSIIKKIIPLSEYKKNINKLKPGLKNLTQKKVHDKYFAMKKHFFLPNFDGLPLELYKKWEKGKKDMLILPYSFVLGCQNNCIFCSMSEKGQSLNAKEPEIVAKELKFLSEKYQTKYFMFLNSNINPNKKYINDLYLAFKKNKVNIIWSDCANLRHMEKDIMLKMKEMGCKCLICGIECPSNKMLKYIKKGITVEKAEELVNLAQKLRIWLELELIIGMPHENEDDFRNTIRFIKKTRKSVKRFHLNRFRLLESLLTLEPEKYKIKIRYKNRGNYKEKIFDEIGGLKWEDKIKQTERFIKKIEDETRKVKTLARNDFELQRIFSDSCEYVYNTSMSDTLINQQAVRNSIISKANEK